MPRLSLCSLALLAPLLAACDVEPGRPAGPPSLALTGEGYPDPGDPCQRSAAQVEDLDFIAPDAPLIACPPGTDGIYANQTPWLTWLGEVDGWTVYAIRPM
ncbi:hypothetical protein [Marinibacterium profundimaris]|uniref:Lipoprotein n=1 Tax=Marinibacterium profundimaris TaxID=1679460 RepID=A0A225NQR5_9RHOB|nr:hypothetical protein [Marinibacterium profundimaris]OWU77235.1 hypothetical protein ATO3_00360 [Marinibacterium profundimaris]